MVIKASTASEAVTEILAYLKLKHDEVCAALEGVTVGDYYTEQWLRAAETEVRKMLHELTTVTVEPK